MTTSILLLHYNNYFNRIVKKLETIADYKLADSNYVVCENINFVPNDGVLTKQVLGKGTNPSDLFTGNKDRFDYAIVFDSSVSSYPILNRWFIMEVVRTRDGQYELTLKRDVIVDNYSAILDAPIYIEKAHISDVNNPLLFNTEGLKVNQIKQAEYPIKDETQSGWVVGYVPRDSFAENTPVDSDVYLASAADIEVNGISSWSYWKNVRGLNPTGEYLMDDTGINSLRFRNKSRYTRSVYSSGMTCYYAKRYVYFKTGTALDQYNAYVSNLQSSSVRGNPAQGNLDSWYEDWTGQEFYAPPTQAQADPTGYFGHSAVPILVGNVYNNSTFKNYVSAFLTAQSNLEVGSTSGLRALDTKIIKDTATNIYYRIKIKSRTQTDYIPVTTSISQGTNVINFLNNNMTRTGLVSWSYTFTGNLASGEVEVKPDATQYWIELEQLAFNLRVNIDSERAHLEDAQYDMFCIPYSDSLQLNDGTDTFTCNKNVALTMATAIGAKAGTQSIYDVQLLPYCPCREAVLKSSDPAAVMNISGISHDVIQAYNSTEGTYGDKYSAIIWCSRSIFDVERSVEDIAAVTNIDAPLHDIEETSPNSYKYYLLYEIPEKTVESDYRFGITTTSSNLLKVAKTDKNTGEIISVDNYNTIEVIWSTSGAEMHIYKQGSSASPEISLTRAQYNSASYYYSIYIDTLGYGGQHVSDEFQNLFKLPSVYYFNAVLSSPENIKISNECDLYRLVSGNYNGIFEFSLAKSGGIDGVKIECNYKPWNPYIHILPKLKGLYGDSFANIDDARGLICGGDFSLTQLSNEWANYQLQNKTYQEMFDRQIKNLDVNNSVAMQQAEYQAVAGAFTGGIGGAVSGALVGAKAGGYGALAGGIVGGVGGLAAGIGGGALDVENLKTLQAETRSYAIDMYNYNLQNIQAIPTSITKTTALTYNTRIWPFIEYHTCTNVEKQAFRDKLKYNGMTVMTIGKLSDYETTSGEKQFFIGDVVRLPDLVDDNHMATEIYNEIKKGVYI